MQSIKTHDEKQDQLAIAGDTTGKVFVPSMDSRVDRRDEVALA
jgi:hypothetical protein